MLNSNIRAKKSQKCIINFKIHTKKAKMKKEKHIRPKQNNYFFSNSKNVYATKRPDIIFQKKKEMQK